jgi:hypothetical protein
LIGATVASGAVAVVAPAAATPAAIAAAAVPIAATTSMLSDESRYHRECKYYRRRYSSNDENEDEEIEERPSVQKENEKIWKAVKELEKNTKKVLQHVREKTPQRGLSPATRRRK